MHITDGGHAGQETGECRQVKGRMEGDCPSLKTDFVDTTRSRVVIRNKESVKIDADDVHSATLIHLQLSECWLNR